MFGYIRPYKPELKQKDIIKYSGLYCTLCEQLKRDYGFVGRFLLNFDITFLLLYLNNIFTEDIQKHKVRCPYNPTKSKTSSCSEISLVYSAFVNYWLATEKLLDDVNDGKNLVKYLLYKYLISKKKYKLRKNEYSQKVSLLTNMLQDVYEREKYITDSFDFDNITNAFGDFFAEIFNVSKDNKFELDGMAQKLFFQVGKWIYIIDAYDDYNEDVKKKRVNILFSLDPEICKNKEIAFEKAFSLHIQLINKISVLLSDLDDVIKDETIKNTLSYGLNHVFYKITQKKYKEYLGRLKENGKFTLEPLDDKN